MLLSIQSKTSLFLTLWGATSFLALAQEADPACDAAAVAFTSALIFGEACTPKDDGGCPSTCVEQFNIWHAACDGKFSTNEDDDTGESSVELYDPISSVGFSFFLNEECKETPINFLLSLDDDLTCADWLALNTASAFLVCSTECTENCKSIIRNVYATCAATDTVTDEDGDTSTAIGSELGASFFRAMECNDFADTLSFEGVGSSAAPITSSVSTSDAPAISPAGAVIGNFPGEADADCDAAVVAVTSDLLFRSKCEDINGVCSDNCVDTFSEWYATCRGKLYTGDNTDDDGMVEVFSPVSLISFGALLPDVCKSVPLESLLQVEDDLSCSDWLDLNTFSSIISCSSECTEDCKTIISNVYSTCSADDTAITDDDDVSSAADVELGASIFRSEECNAFAQTLTFEGGNGGSDETPSETSVTATPSMGPITVPAATSAPVEAAVTTTEAPVMGPTTVAPTPPSEASSDTTITTAPVSQTSDSSEAPVAAALIDASEAPVAAAPIDDSEAVTAAPTDELDPAKTSAAGKHMIIDTNLFVLLASVVASFVSFRT